MTEQRTNTVTRTTSNGGATVQAPTGTKSMPVYSVSVIEQARAATAPASQPSTYLQFAPGVLQRQLSPEVMSQMVGQLERPEVRLERYRRMWEADRAWVSKASLRDTRIAGACGGGACNAPYCTWQFWNVDGLTCNAENFVNVMFPMDRYLFAQAELRVAIGGDWGLRSLSAITGQYAWKTQHDFGGDWRAALEANRMETQRLQAAASSQISAEASMIAAAPRQWAERVVKAQKLIGLMRWATNARSWMLDQTLDSIGEGRRSRLITNFQQLYAPVPRVGTGCDGCISPQAWAERQVGNPVPVALKPALKVWAYEQAGWSTDYSPNFGDYRTGGQASMLPPIMDMPAPQAEADFEPFWPFVASAADRTRIRLGGSGSAGGVNGLWAAPTSNIDELVWDPAKFGMAHPGGSVTDKLTALFSSTTRAGRLMSWYIVAETLLQAKEFSGLLYTRVLEDTLTKWQTAYQSLPEAYRTMRPLDIAATMRAAKQAELDMAASVVGAVGGLVTSVVAAINPIAGVVVGIVFAVATLLIRFAQDIGLTRAPNPPCLTAPFLRMIPATTETMACDFDPHTLGYSNTALRADVIRTGASMGLPPAAWYDALKRLDAQQPSRLPDPDTAQAQTTTRAIAVVAGITLGLVIAKFAL